MKLKRLLLTISLLAASSSAMAFQAGDILVRGGIANVTPDDSSTNITVNGTDIGAGDINVKSDTQLMLNASYFFKNNWNIELLAATPFEHEVDFGRSNPLGTGDLLGDLKHLPPTLFVNYYIPTSSSRFHPYIGAGLNYTFFFDEEFSSANRAAGLSDLELDSSFGLAAQIGMDYKIDDNWYLNAAVRYIDIDTEVTFKSGGISGKVNTLNVDPWVPSLSIGYRF